MRLGVTRLKKKETKKKQYSKTKSRQSFKLVNQKKAHKTSKSKDANTVSLNSVLNKMTRDGDSDQTMHQNSAYRTSTQCCNSENE